MIFIKYISLTLILGISIYIGNIISKRYVDREKELIEMKKALAVFKTKIKFTYEPLYDIFYDISVKATGNISVFFENVCLKIKNESAEKAWSEALNITTTEMTKDDIDVLQGLGKLLGKTDLEGQIREIELVDTFLDTQIKQAREEKEKNEKLYRTLGITIGLTLVIILV